MQLYHSIGPNPRLVGLFLAEKGISLPRVTIDVLAGENRREPYLSLNPAGGLPALQLDSGEVLAETVAICEYLEELHPEPALIGRTAVERARTRMWLRRVDLFIVQPLTQGFRGAEGLALFKDRVRCLPQAADDLKATARDGLAWLEAQLQARARPGEAAAYIAGPALTLADLMLFSFVEFAAMVGQPLNPAHTRLAAWREHMAARPSARATA